MSETTAASMPRWAGPVLVAAAIYNLVWGAVTVLYPAWLFDLTGLEPPKYPFIWQCVGMIVGVYGIGYWAAARDPARHWPIVLVGFLGKIFGPIGYADGLRRGVVPAEFGWTIPTNDLIWWIPFAMILWASIRINSDRRSSGVDGLSVDEAMKQATNQSGSSLAELSHQARVLVVFLRHSGCTFCREALQDLSKQREQFQMAGVRLALVHMDPEPERAKEYFAKYELSEADLIADPEQRIYEAFDLQRGTFGQLFGLKVWWRGFVATFRGNSVGKLIGDGFQMPGAFLVEDGRVVDAYRHQTAADRPDYQGLATVS